MSDEDDTQGADIAGGDDAGGDDAGGDEITREEGPSGGRYVLRRGEAEAELTYSRLSPTRIVVDHTGVPDAMRGTGAGVRLIARLVADARAEGVRAVPLCRFVKVQAERHPDWRDVIEGA